MARKAFTGVAVVCALVWGCAIVEPEMDSPVVADPPGFVQLPPAELPAQPSLGEPPPESRPDGAQPQLSIPGIEEVRLLQEGLRSSGFDPGAADGIFGPKTRQAWQRIVAACAMLQDLVEPALVLNKPGERLDHDEVKILQVRLKDAGFDPGSIDGIVGPRTSSALARLHSGCALTRSFSMTVGGELLSTRQQTHSTPRPIEGFVTEPVAGAGSALHDLTSMDRETVRRLQLRLKEAGFDPGPPDGMMGPKTRAAVKRYEAYLSGCNCQEISAGRRLQ